MKTEKKPKSSAQRQKKSKDKKRAAGLVPIEIWTHPDDKPIHKELERELLEKRGLL